MTSQSEESAGTPGAKSPSLEVDRADYVLDDQIGFCLRQAYQRHVAIFSSMIEDGLTSTQWAALVKLRDLQPCSQGTLGREAAMDMATIKGVVDRLVNRGLVHSISDKLDARRLVLTLTAAGIGVVERNLPIAFEISKLTTVELSPAERMVLIELLQKIG